MNVALALMFGPIGLGAPTTAVTPASPDPLAPVETRVECDLKGKVFTFSRSFDGVTQYRGFYAYDAAKKTIVFSYPSADGGLADGTVEPKDGSLLWDFQRTESDGNVNHFQVSQKDAWAKLFEIHYHRTQS
jgi:hypothetical protein